MSLVQGTFSIKCDNNSCGKQHNFPAEKANFDFEGSDERQMGPENSYSWNNNFNCDCGDEIEFEYGIWEYPVGVFNHDNVEIDGGTEIQRYDYDFHEEPEREDI